MKKSVLLSLLMAFSMIGVEGFAQDTLKEGKYVVVTTYPDGKEVPDYKHTDPVIYFKNGSSRREFSFDETTSTHIYNAKTGEEYFCENEAGDKHSIITTAEELKNRVITHTNIPEVYVTNDTKTILGFHCKKATLIFPIDSLKHLYECWYTKEIQLTNPVENFYATEFGIDGFIMEMTVWNGRPYNFSTKTTIKSIEKIRVPDSLFNLTRGYTITTWDDLIKEKDASIDSIRKDAKRTELRNDSLYKENKPIEDSLIRNTFPLGSTFPEIELNDTSGNSLKLSSLRGKYVLVDFWASWCNPCRQENPNVVKAYNKYKDKGFTVYSISLDDKKLNWVKAIRHDKLEWPNHVCDFYAWHSPVVAQFIVTGIPFNYLIDKEGKVIAYNLHDDDLEQALSKYIK